MGARASQMLLVVKNPPANVVDTSSIPGPRRSSAVANGTPLQNSCLENSRGREVWQATVHGATKSQTD